MKALKKVLATTLALALVMTSMAAFDATDVLAKGKVKSISVTKKVDLKVGQSKTVKVKIKTKGKASKKFTTKVSKKGIVKVTKKSGKIVIKALKVGTTKITVKSKANKKKKKTIKVVVTSADITMSVKQVTDNRFQLAFSKAVKLEASNLAIESKKYKSGKYVNAVKPKEVSTIDSKVYVVKTDYYFDDGEMIRFTVKGVNKANIVKEIESSSEVITPDKEEVITLKTNETFDTSYQISDYVARGKGKVSSATAYPAGVIAKIEDGSIKLSGKIAKEGIYKTTINFVDELDNTSKLTLVFVVGSENNLQVYAPKCVLYTYFDDKYSTWRYGSNMLYIAGGSGLYTWIIQSKPNEFDDSIYKDEDNIFSWEYEDIAKPGTYTGKVSIIDANNSNIAKTVDVTVEAKKGLLVSGTITSMTGKPVIWGDVFAISKGHVEGMGAETSSYSDDKGYYRLVVGPGKYGIYASTCGATSQEFEKDVKANTILNLKIPAYQVAMKSNSAAVPSDWFTDWATKDTDSYVGSGNILFLGKGSYDIHCAGYNGGSNYEYEASAKFTVTGDMTVTATVAGKKIAEKTLVMNANQCSLNEDGELYLFEPATSGTYRFVSSNNEGDPAIEVRDAWGDYVGSGDDDDGNNFDLTVDLEGGEKYYIELLDYAGYDIKSTVTISYYN